MFEEGNREAEDGTEDQLEIDSDDRAIAETVEQRRLNYKAKITLIAIFYITTTLFIESIFLKIMFSNRLPYEYCFLFTMLALLISIAMNVSIFKSEHFVEEDAVFLCLLLAE